MISVEGIMTQNPYTLKEADSINDAVLLINEKKIRHIPIVNDKGELQGLVTQRDLIAHFNDLDMSLSSVMKRNIYTINPYMNLRSAALLMQKYKIGCLPVLSGRIVIGIITDSDYVAVAINLLEQMELSEPDVIEA